MRIFERSKTMVRYLIKVTYLEGEHEGKTYLLRKGGYVTDENNLEWEDTTYARKKFAQKWCKELEYRNRLDRDIERRDEQERIRRGGKPNSFYIYHYERYEPVAVTI